MIIAETLAVRPRRNGKRAADASLYICTRCEIAKVAECFSIRTSGSRHSWCKECKREHDGEKRSMATREIVDMCVNIVEYYKAHPVPGMKPEDAILYEFIGWRARLGGKPK